jgi:hypothetical protein
MLVTETPPRSCGRLGHAAALLPAFGERPSDADDGPRRGVSSTSGRSVRGGYMYTLTTGASAWAQGWRVGLPG